MGRSAWSVYINESGDSWEFDFNLYVPNVDINDEIVSTQQTVILADGSKAFITPETKSNVQTISFAWMLITSDDDLISKIKTYIEDNTRLKIVTHLSEEYIGKFISLRKTHLVGISPDQWEVEAVFERE
jgi:hypothetical protein